MSDFEQEPLVDMGVYTPVSNPLPSMDYLGEPVKDINTGLTPLDDMIAEDEQWQTGETSD